MNPKRHCQQCSSILPELLGDVTCPTCGTLQKHNETARPLHTLDEAEQNFVVQSESRTIDYHELTKTRIPDTLFAEPTQPNSSNPPQLANYRDLTWVGHGGMGTVFRGIQQGIERTVAIKVMRTTVHRNSQLRQRFENEVRALAKIEHRGIVRVYEYGECPAGPYYSMDFVDGSTLNQLVKKRGLLPYGESVRLVREAASAIQAAHRVRIYHRDIKPSNIMVDAEGAVKVTDFGLAKHHGDNELTGEGDTLGTPCYMAYEQALGDQNRVDNRTDVYGLGATLFYLLTGKPPRNPSTNLNLVEQFQSSATPSPRLLKPEICPILDAIVQKSLAREQADRYQSVEEFSNDLGHWTNREPTIAHPPTRLQRVLQSVRKNRVAIAAAVLVSLVMTGIAVARRESDPQHQLERALAQGKPFALIPTQGEPRWSRWESGPATPDLKLTREGAFAFQTFALSHLELCRAVPSRAFRFEVELRQVNATKSSSNGISWVGFYYRSPETVDYRGATLARYLMVTLADHHNYRVDGKKSEKPGLLTVRDGIRATLGVKEVFPTSPQHPLNYAVTADAQGEPVWKRLAIEITEKGYRIYFGDLATVPELVHSRDFSEANAPSAGMEISLRDDLQLPTPIPLPLYRVGGPIGLCVQNTAAAFRNAVITPLEPSE